MHERMNVLSVQGKEILSVDFSGFNEAEMIGLVKELLDYLILNRQVRRVLITLNESNYLTSVFMQAFRTYRKEERAFQLRVAVLGLNVVKQMIVKAYNMFEKRDARAFGSREEALNYLLNE